MHLQLLPQATLITGMESIAFAEAVGADLNYRTLKELRYALSAGMFNILAFLLLSWPVSYTHLDVYKRQIYICINDNLYSY